ncbi:hypothetical protein HAHE_10070 [Haloferula helveola]|uniref:Squalene cyclase C-terminal domain-containing protein n=1 Tax=Haloferula helveola TaxID=490095 RepID=A0ABM7R9Y2_9BACT|nr:hypothetical protein HAHE_10070 [Haloferula helveola]
MKLQFLTALLASSLLYAETSIEAPPAAPAPAKTTEVAPTPEPSPAPQPEPKPVSEPKPLGTAANNGLAWLAKTQNADGGWGQGGGWRVNLSNGQGGGRVEGADVADPSDIGNTAIVLQAFIRAGFRADKGEYSAVTSRAAEFILSQVEKCDSDTLFVTDVRDTQLQSKIGRYVDTFLAAQILSELKGQLSEANEARRAKLLDKVIAKIEKHQNDEGAFAGNSGWAATLSQGICSNALNSAFAAGAKIKAETLEKDHLQNADGLDRQTGTVAAGRAVGDAGVDIYRYASKLRGMTGYAWTNDKRRQELNTVVNSPTASDNEKEQASDELKKIDRSDADQQVLLKQVAAKAGEQKFVNGFGNNGGEEFISYMNIGEALRSEGGEAWTNWDAKMTKTLNDAQNADGSWSGQHCITGRTFCTASALMVLMTDRAPVPVESPIAAKDGQDQQ